MAVYTDVNHLHQVLWNLCANAVKYSVSEDNDLIITLTAYTDSATNAQYLEVVDNGPGISPKEQE